MDDWKSLLGGLITPEERLELDREASNSSKTSSDDDWCLDGVLELKYEKKGRAGKPVTIVEGYQGSPSSHIALSKELKQFCGVGGTLKDGQIIIQGNVREKITPFLQERGFKTKRIGG